MCAANLMTTDRRHSSVQVSQTLGNEARASTDGRDEGGWGVDGSDASRY